MSTPSIARRPTRSQRTRGREAGPFDRSVDVLMSRLRRKLGVPGGEDALFKTVRNGGYQLAVRVEREEAV